MKNADVKNYGMNEIFNLKYTNFINRTNKNTYI